MALLHDRIRSLTSSNSEQVKETLAQYFQKLTKTTDSDHSQWLDSLESILTRFPKFCLQHRATAETYLVQFLDSENDSWIIAAAKCSHVLQQVRPSYDKAATAKSSWRHQMSLLCSAAHDLMGAAFSDAVDLYKNMGYFPKVPEEAGAVNTVFGATLSQLSSSLTRLAGPGKTKADHVTLGPLQKNALLCKRLRNVFTFIQAMLVEVYPAGKPVRPHLVLDTVVRALSMTSGSKRQPTVAPDGQTSADVALVKTQALRTLDALVVCLSSDLIPYSPLVFRVVSQTLRWSADQTGEESMNVRRGCYASLARWLSALQCHRLQEGVNLEEELLTRLLDDIAPRTYLVQLTMSNQSTKNLSKKAKRKMANTMLGQSGLANHIPGEKNKEEVIEEDPAVVLAALQCLEVLLTTCGIFLKPATHKKVQECLVRQCYALGAATGSDGARGAAAVRALEACRLAAPASLAPPTQHCLAIYSRLLLSPHSQVSQFCARALQSVRVSLHAAPPTLSFAPLPPQGEAPPERPVAAVSERNRAVLAALLGDDKLPPRKLSEEVITILDESNGRKRKGDEVDKISVSSQSSNEVEIDESNGVDLDSPGTNFEEPIEVDETDYTPGPSMSNGRMKLLDFDKKAKDTPDGSLTVHELATQMPLNVSNDSIAADDSDSIEVSYDHSSNVDERVKYLEKLDGDNLPSTGETDDVQITCGQTFRCSAESTAEKTSSGVADGVSGGKALDETAGASDTVIVADADPKVDIENEEANNIETSVTVCDSAKVETLDVEEMLADFVNE